LKISKNRLEGESIETFNCICHSLQKVCRLHYWLPSKEEENTENDVIFFTILTSSWRTNIIPYSFSIKDLFIKKNQEYTPISKKYWKEYYYGSLWKQWGICFKYLFFNNVGLPPLDVIVLDQEDCQRFLNILIKYEPKTTKEDIKEIVIHSKESDISLRIDLDVLKWKKEEDTIVGLSFSPIFKPKKGIKKLFYILKYIFNYKCNCQDKHFIFDKEIVLKLNNLLKKVTECPTI